MFKQVYFHKTPPAFEYYLGKAIEEGEVSFTLDRGLEDLVDLRDDTLFNQLFQARSHGGSWSRRLLDREPAKLVLRENMGADKQENSLSAELVTALKEAGCHVFSRRKRQVFTTLAEAGGQSGGTQLFCERRILGHPIIEPVAEHSDLLSTFNKPIDIRNTYVLREDMEKAAKVMEKMKIW